MEKNFKPLDLNGGIVGRLFNNCLYTSESKNHTAAIFHMVSQGYPEDSDPVFFDKDAIDANKNLINFLLGQLNDAHKGPLTESTVQTLFMKYTGEPWTKDGITLLKLIHLALANMSIAPFSADKDRTFLLTVVAKNPTLSPKDPNFSEWWEKHKAEWE